MCEHVLLELTKYVFKNKELYNKIEVIFIKNWICTCYTKQFCFKNLIII